VTKKQKKDVDCPYDAKEESVLTETTKAYKNLDFLNSRAARSIRIMCEFEEPRRRLRENHIQGTLLIFGSARSLSRADHALAVSKLEQDIAKSTDGEKAKLEQKLLRLQKSSWMCDYCGHVEELSRRLTEWTMKEDVRTGKDIKGTNPQSLQTSALQRFNSQALQYLTEDTPSQPRENAGTFPQHMVVCTGGGPGIMEAANKGAASVPGSKNMGMGISLPFEEGLNRYVTSELAFEFHYFFTRKFWMLYQAHCIIVFPGGFGTFDELFEACTLKQTGKLRPDLPIVLFGKKYWEKVVNWQALVDMGTISQQDVDDILFTDCVDEAFNHITTRLAPNKLDDLNGHPSPSRTH
jgi:uncharacterized protein (TIGR00730 family)